MDTTLRRLWLSLTAAERLRFGLQVALERFVPHSEAMVELLKTDGHVEELMAGVHEAFPTAAEVLIRERDRWMVGELARAHEDLKARQERGGLDLGPTNGRIVIVAVVGMGHRRGIAREWETYTRTGRVPEVERRPDPRPPREKRLLDGFLLCGSFLYLTTVLTGCRPLAAPLLGLAGALLASGITVLGRWLLPSSDEDGTPAAPEVEWAAWAHRFGDRMALRWTALLAWTDPAASAALTAAVLLIGGFAGRLDTCSFLAASCVAGLLLRLFRVELAAVCGRIRPFLSRYSDLLHCAPRVLPWLWTSAPTPTAPRAAT